MYLAGHNNLDSANLSQIVIVYPK